jgi:hypothetical protein
MLNQLTRRTLPGSKYLFTVLNLHILHSYHIIHMYIKQRRIKILNFSYSFHCGLDMFISQDLQKKYSYYQCCGATPFNVAPGSAHRYIQYKCIVQSFMHSFLNDKLPTCS